MMQWFCLIVLCVFLGMPGVSQAQGGGNFIFLASTIGPIDSGIVDALENQFEKETGIRVRHVGAGTGAALDIARKGTIDLVMVHAKSLEEKFVQEGFGTERIDLMYNDFVIVGPSEDPAGIRGMKTAAEALKAIAAKGAPFVTRGDKSGTHVAELELWQKAGIKPAGSWYMVYEKGSEGNAPTLRYTDQKKAYTVIDRATFLSLQKDIKLQVLVEKDEAMLNYISLIPVNPKKFGKVNYEGAMTFVKWLTAPGKGQAIIRDFGKDKYGSPLFFPNSKEWKQAK
ncbi:MAG: PBP superfamily domain protein [Syntrophorhabdus sp. PtaU1.Bin002]|nr:MAG: PBP superfamily domain protein [Syntrophorhabdus sp. PtaB.Bin006]OPY74000.1 MAG: PBP superfamily domain protein [Syntrophorhabdus sp. PtaU1.Bin002]